MALLIRVWHYLGGAASCREIGAAAASGLATLLPAVLAVLHLTAPAAYEGMLTAFTFDNFIRYAQAALGMNVLPRMFVCQGYAAVTALLFYTFYTGWRAVKIDLPVKLMAATAVFSGLYAFFSAWGLGRWALIICLICYTASAVAAVISAAKALLDSIM